MKGKEPEKEEIERLAEIRAKRRLRSWSEQFNSVWTWLNGGLGFCGVIGLLTWIGWLKGELNVTVPVVVTLVIVCLGWLFNRGQKRWEEKRFRELYEEELLELKLKK